MPRRSRSWIGRAGSRRSDASCGDRAAQHDHRGERDRHDHDRADRGLRKALVGRKAVDADGQRVEVERPDQQRRRQFLHHLDEGHDARRQDRSAQQRQMDAA